jgi:hypothetical protein
MIKITRILTRPSTEIPFHEAEESCVEYFRHTYEERGMVTLMGISLSEDELTKTYINMYASQEVHEIIFDDPIIMECVGVAKKYNSENGITVNRLIEEIE